VPIWTETRTWRELWSSERSTTASGLNMISAYSSMWSATTTSNSETLMILVVFPHSGQWLKLARILDKPPTGWLTDAKSKPRLRDEWPTQSLSQEMHNRREVQVVANDAKSISPLIIKINAPCYEQLGGGRCSVRGPCWSSSGLSSDSGHLGLGVGQFMGNVIYTLVILISNVHANQQIKKHPSV